MTDDIANAILARLDTMHGEIREMVRVMERHVAADEAWTALGMERHVAADEAWTALGARVVGALTESVAGRALVAIVAVRVLFGSTADTLLLAAIQQAFGVTP